MELLIVTGMSGAGKSIALSSLEDIGYYCVDNIPPMLIPSFIDLSSKADSSINRIAIVCDSRGGGFFDDLSGVLENLGNSQDKYAILFLDASDTELARRYAETRRKHPLCETEHITVAQALKKEREMLSELRQKANYIIDTTSLTAGQLKKRINSLFVNNSFGGMNIEVMSFGFKNGPVTDANLVFDVRCLDNPYYVPELKTLTGLDKEVRDFVLKSETAKEFEKRLLGFIDYAVPLYKEEGKSELVIAVGCTGGKHRSVTFAEIIYKYLLEKGYKTTVSHRDIEK
ncbi:MAG: RNase adapter RapZ [Oscillospiraceae bacterium]|nr:RNase adapter RapZ [Candidatus Equicaccousia limihippi]